MLKKLGYYNGREVSQICPYCLIELMRRRSVHSQCIKADLYRVHCEKIWAGLQVNCSCSNIKLSYNRIYFENEWLTRFHLFWHSQTFFTATFSACEFSKLAKDSAFSRFFIVGFTTLSSHLVAAVCTKLDG